MASVIGRDVAAAQAREHDLVVVGGGIYGVAVALESARRGLRPLLVEREDFGGGTSWNSLRIVHGGLRYLQTLDLVRFRESVRERGWLLARFPELVRPLPCLMPLYGRGLRRPAVFRVAFAMERRLAARALAPDLTDGALPAGRVLTPAETAERYPGVDRERLLGAALWHDASMPSSQRVLIEMLRWACSAGASALNRVEAVGLLRSGPRVAGVVARDALTGRRLELQARVVVNCAGPSARSLASRLDRDLPRLFHPSLAFNLLLARLPVADTAVAVDSSRAGGGTYFLHPWGECTLAGTFHAPVDPSRVPGEVGEELVAAFLDDLSAGVPEWRLSPQDVRRVHWGLLPVSRPGTTILTGREALHDHAAVGGPSGLYTVSGIKFTTARAVAERVVGRAFPESAAAPNGAPPRPEPAGWPGRDEFERLLADDPARAASVVLAIAREESAHEADDVVLRRTDWGFDPRARDRLAPTIRAMLEAARPAGGAS